MPTPDIQIPPPPGSPPNPTQPPPTVPIADPGSGPQDALKTSGGFVTTFGTYGNYGPTTQTKFGATPEQWGGYFRHLITAIGAAIAADPSLVEKYFPPQWSRPAGVIGAIIAVIWSHQSKT